MTADIAAPAFTPEIRMRAVLASQQAAQLREGPPSAALRRQRLDALIGLLVDHESALIDAIDTDFGGRAKPMSRIADIAGSIESLKFARARLEGWMKPEKRAVIPPIAALLGARAELHFAPKGVVGIISPWNFPVQLAFAPLAGVVAAGNRAMLKPSEFTPLTSALVAELFAKTFDASEIAVVLGGAETGAAFAALPFDHLVFTGATSVARHVMRAAADNLTPLTLELGGKSPVVISRSADLALTAARVWSGKTMNAGQICLAPDYALAPRDKLGEFAAAVEAAHKRMYPDGALGSPDYTAMISDRHYERVRGYLADALAKGAEIRSLEPAGEGDARAADNRRFLAPTLILNATPDMKVMQDEIFGPLLPVMGYDRIEQAIEHINAGPRPLALYYFGNDKAEEREVLSRTLSGGTTVNDVIYHVAMEDLPFGGIGPSGMGAYHGRDGFREFSHKRALYRQLAKDLGPLRMMRPPYGAGVKAYLDARVKR